MLGHGMQVDKYCDLAHGTFLVSMFPNNLMW